jgi:hypothetical protein
MTHSVKRAEYLLRAWPTALDSLHLPIGGWATISWRCTLRSPARLSRREDRQLNTIKMMMMEKVTNVSPNRFLKITEGKQEVEVLNIKPFKFNVAKEEKPGGDHMH